MSSCSATWRIPARLVKGHLRRRVPSRGFSKSASRWAAQNFYMPAMSPTMTEGNIASWKVKEGDSFSVGDVLLEIETDKAQMDVEAQEDGVVAKITQQDGAKAIKVGSRIAVLAEPGDDISSLEISEEQASPSESESKASEPVAKESSAPKPSEQSPATSPPKRTPEQPSGKISSRNYPLYPSVQHLLHTNGMSAEDASRIQRSGPGGRLLKGDVLAHLGRIDKSYSSNLSERISNLEHLDLSNIKKSPSAAAKQEAGKLKPAEPTIGEVELATQIGVPISLSAVVATQKRIQDTLGTFLPLSTFIARASELANDDLPKPMGPPTAEELFDAVLGLDKVGARTAKVSRGNYMPQIASLPPAGSKQWGPSSPPKKVDLIDDLAGIPTGAPKVPKFAVSTIAAGGMSGVSNVFTLSIPKVEEKRAMVYLERVKSVLESEPGRLVL